jgi:hypothetical protein
MYPNMYLYVYVCICMCMYVHVCTSMSLYEVNISLYVPEALRAGRQARQQEQVGQRARRQAGRAPVIGFQALPVLQDPCSGRHLSQNPSPSGLTVWRPHDSSLKMSLPDAGHGQPSQSG